MRKKVLSLFICALILGGLVGCFKKNNDAKDTDTSNKVVTEEKADDNELKVGVKEEDKKRRS